jgi:hypothetical protein
MVRTGEAERLRDIVRAKDPMRGLCQEKLITPEACDWAKFALDPFHDQQLDNLRGYPDVATEPTVVVKIRQAATVSAPPGLPEGSTWDCHMVLSPIDYAPRSANVGVAAQPMGQIAGTPSGEDASDAAAGLITQATAPTGSTSGVARFDGLVINSVPGEGSYGHNETFTPGHMPRTAANGYQVQNITLDNYLDYSNTDLGVYRIIYSGFEVVNTTAQIKKQGAVTVYEYGNSYEVGASIPAQHQSTNVVPVGIYNPTTWFRCPPNTIAEAKIMPGSHSWAAQDGSYNTAKFQTENPFQGLTARPWVVCQNEAKGGADSGYFTPAPFIGTGAPYSAGSIASSVNLAHFQNVTVSDPAYFPLGSPGPAHFSRMNTSGAYFTGLSAETTLFVTWRVGIERLPAANKPAFLALSQPSATFDPNALVLYNMVANVLPPGCPQGYNDAGKWFNWIANAAKNAIPSVYPIVRAASMVANATGNPISAQALSAVAGRMKPIAEAQAAKRLQAAARNKQTRQNPPKKLALQNWSKGKGVPGGVNGLR